MITSDVDSIRQWKRLRRQAKLAREWFAAHGPSDAQPLPLSYDECEDLKHGGVLHILAWYARSVACLGYLIEEHPSFDDYARGVMASDVTPNFIRNDDGLRRRFPPILLEGLDDGSIWERPVKNPKADGSETENAKQRRPSRAA